MSLTLALNTASRESALALFEAGTIVEEVTWESQSRGSEQVLPRLEEMLARHGKTWKDLSRLVVVKGPGPYTSLRVGISIINSMAWALKIPIRTVGIFEVWKNRVPEGENKQEYTVVISAGKTHYMVEGAVSPQPWEEIEVRGSKYVGELPMDYSVAGVDLRTFGQGLMTLDASRYEDLPMGEFAEPVYSRPPLVTVAKKP
jgi:tRNA threonylcarbamoyl adenosine modification protein YeaZ